MLNKSLLPRTITIQNPLILGKQIVRGYSFFRFRAEIGRKGILELFILELFRMKIYRRFGLIVPYMFRSRESSLTKVRNAAGSIFLSINLTVTTVPYALPYRTIPIRYGENLRNRTRPLCTLERNPIILLAAVPKQRNVLFK